MTHTDHPDTGAAPTQPDGVNFKGLGWSMVILAIITLLCYALVVGLFKFMESRVASSDPARAPLAAPAAQPRIVDGRIESGTTTPVPSLLVTEPMNLKNFRAHEEEILTTYGWVDQNAGIVRLPIEDAKALLLKQGLPVRESR
jgi:hypothetical protein